MATKIPKKSDLKPWTEPDITFDHQFYIVPSETMPEEDTGCVPAFYKYPRTIHSADVEVLDADWGQSEGTRQVTDEFTEAKSLK